MYNLREELLKNHDGFIFDLDGVIWLGKEGIPFAKEALAVLRDANKKILFVTNNASETKEFQRQKLIAQGIACESNEVLNSGYASGLYLKEKGNVKRVHALGTDQLKEELIGLGFDHVNEGADAVVVGLDKGFSYQKLDTAFQNLFQKDCLFVATNKDAVYPAENGYHPGTGTSVIALEFAVSRPPDVIIGKPEPIMLKMSLDFLKTDPRRTIIIGDLLDKDIIWGLNGGLKSCYVLSGVGTKEDIDKLGISPDYVSESVGHAFGVC